MDAVHAFETGEGRAVGKKDMTQLLKDAKVLLAKTKGTSTLVVSSSTCRLRDNYMSLLPQLDAKTLNVQ